MPSRLTPKGGMFDFVITLQIGHLTVTVVKDCSGTVTTRKGHLMQDSRELYIKQILHVTQWSDRSRIH